jgi:hypothetical protein
MEHLFYNELGGTRSTPIALSTDPDLNLFYSIAPGDYAHKIDFYWSAKTSGIDANFALTFGFNNTYYSGIGKPEYKWLSHGHAWGVIEGDIAAVPLPGAVWLMGSGLVGLIGLKKILHK